MSSNQRNRQLGPYVLGARYKHTGDLGRLYRARHAQTGAPALVLEPTGRHPEDEPLADWQLRVSSSVEPAYLALEVESAPETADARDAGEELEVMLDDWRLAVAHALGRSETLRHLRKPNAPARRERADWRPGAFVGALAAGLAVLVVHSTPTAPAPSSPEPGLARAQIAPAGLVADGELTGAAFTGMGDLVPTLIARPMPKKPFRIQKKPPCEATLEEEHFDGCWVPHETRAPCPEKLYELGGKCFLPAVQAPPPPSSIVH